MSDTQNTSKEEVVKKKIGVEDFEFGKTLGEGSFGDVRARSKVGASHSQNI